MEKQISKVARHAQANAKQIKDFADWKEARDDTSTALMANQNIRYEEGGEILFASPVAQSQPAKRIVAVGRAKASQPFNVTTEAKPVPYITDNGKGAKSDFSMYPDQSEERRQIIINQVRFAENRPQLEQALEAAYWYNPSVYQCMQSQYGDRFMTEYSESKATAKTLEQGCTVGLAWIE